MGVNAFTEGSDDETPDPLHRSRDRADPAQAPARGEAPPRHRPGRRRRSPASARDAADPTVNLMPAILDAVEAYATEGEIIAALQDEFGTWIESTIV